MPRSPFPGRPGRAVIAAALAAFACALSGAAAAQSAPERHDYPTLDRVRYVQQCMRDHPGPSYEMTSKCVCVVDALARQLTLDQFEEMSTALNANTIGGERGNNIRDADYLQKEIRQYRELQAKAKRGCFIDPDAKR